MVYGLLEKVKNQLGTEHFDIDIVMIAFRQASTACEVYHAENLF